MTGCRWIDSEPPRLGNMCGIEPFIGYPYCLEHCERAYIGFEGRGASRTIQTDDGRLMSVQALEAREQETVLAERNAKIMLEAEEVRRHKPKAPKLTWSLQDEKWLIRLHLEGLSVLQIARKMLRPKGSIAGKIDRLRKAGRLPPATASNPLAHTWKRIG